MSRAQRLISAFVIGASLPSAAITFAYNAVPFAKGGRPSSIPYEQLPFVVPLVLGLFTLVMYVLAEDLNWDYRIVAPVVGLVAGEVMSLIGHYGYRIPEKLYKSSRPWVVHAVAPVVYAAIFSLVIAPLVMYLVHGTGYLAAGKNTEPANEKESQKESQTT